MNKYVYKIFIDGELQFQRSNHKPRTFVNVWGRMGHAYEPERNYDSSLGRFRNLKFNSFETPQYCVKVTSGDDAACRAFSKDPDWWGDDIELHFKTKDFTNHVATLERRETEMEFCLPIDQVNIMDDVFTLKATGMGVCITSLTVNNEKLLVGKNNDQDFFWLDDLYLWGAECTDEYMLGDVLQIQNGRVYKSACKRDNIRRGDFLRTDITVFERFDISIMLNLKKNTESGWPNIFGFQKEGVKAYDNGYPIGSRIPAVWLLPNSNALHICMALNDNGNSCWNSPEMPVDTWFQLNIRQGIDKVNKRYLYQILIDGEVKQTVTNKKPMVFEGVNGILGNSYQPERNYKTAVGQFKDFHFTTLPSGFESGSDTITPGLSCSAGTATSRIVGGNIAKKGSWPWLVSLTDETGRHICGGTILSDTRILARLN